MAFATKPKPSPKPVNKKRVGQHHRQSRHYVKQYWPYLPLLAIVAVGLLVNSMWPSGMAVLGTSSNLSDSSLLASTNNQRTLSHDAALALNSQLSSAAESKAQDMVQKNYWSHTTPSGASPWSFVQQAGYSYQRAGENLAYGFTDANAVITAWMHSPEHRANLLNAAYQQVGFGVASTPNYLGHGPATVVVALYGTPAPGATQTAAYMTSASNSDVKGAHVIGRPTTRLAVLSGGQTSLATMTAACLISLAAVVFIVRHGRLLQRSLIRSETFVMQHLWFDILLVAILTVGFVLTRTVGITL